MKYTAPIVHGKGRGKLLGFPTFNLQIPGVFELPFGIYAAQVWIDKKAYGGALHYGPIPTFHEAAPTLEIFVLDYADTAEVQVLSFEIVQYLREVQAFPNQEALHDQIAKDVAQTRLALRAQKLL